MLVLCGTLVLFRNGFGWPHITSTLVAGGIAAAVAVALYRFGIRPHMPEIVLTPQQSEQLEKLLGERGEEGRQLSAALLSGRVDDAQRRRLAGLTQAEARRLYFEAADAEGREAERTAGASDQMQWVADSFAGEEDPAEAVRGSRDRAPR